MVVPTVHQVELTLLISGGQSQPVPSLLRHEPSDPWAVGLVMTVQGESVEWVFARDLLAAGLAGPAGVGDIRIHPCASHDGDPVVHIELGNPDGHAVLRASAGAVARFLDATYQSVPAGREAEHLDIDATLTRLLAGC
jgi:hypothetical protein